MNTLNSNIKCIEAKTKQDFTHAGKIFREYTDSLGIDLSFQNFEQELEQIKSIYTPPWGSLLLLKYKGLFTGCVGLKRFDEFICEMKRLYIKPEFRGKGWGKILCLKIIEKAKQLDYHRMRLDTLPSLTAAHTLYKNIGFYPINPYYHNPIPETIYMELKLK